MRHKERPLRQLGSRPNQLMPPGSIRHLLRESLAANLLRKLPLVMEAQKKEER
jgi:hypothetical protein